MKDFEDGTFDEVHDYTPESELLLTRGARWENQNWDIVNYDADTVDEVSNFDAGGEIEDFDLVNIGASGKRGEQKFL